MSGKYDDIIDLPHHVSSRRAPMAMIDRAAQFAPFAALTGHDAVIRETARLTDQPIELDESSRAELDAKLRLLAERIGEQPEITVTYFVPDERKVGGAYITSSGRVKKVDAYSCSIILTDGTGIGFERIIELCIL